MDVINIGKTASDKLPQAHHKIQPTTETVEPDLFKCPDVIRLFNYD